jgi:energy-coupling factor transporter ATP-binding protein EcfA2
LLNYELNSSEKEFELLENEFHGEASIVNPFPGLRPFGVDECHLFFGRESQVDEVLVKLADNRFITVLGYSGSGKSSLMYCGIIPILYGGFMTDTGANWNIIVSRPGYAPLDNLAESLIQHDPGYANASEEDRLIKRTVAAAILRGGSSGLIDIARQYKTITGDNLFVLIDQFEEIFRYRDTNPDNADEAAAFIRLLLEAVESDDVPIYVAITMRSDFIGECAHYPGLTELINQSSYVIPQMTREQKRMAVEGPIAVGGGRIAPRLVKRVLKDVGDNQDQLPIMQHALMRTWDYWAENREKGEELDFRHYNAVGRISEALSQHADEAYEQLSTNHKHVAEVLFKRLTEKGSDNYGIRRPGTVREIARVADVDESIVIEVVEHFRQPGLSLLMPPANVDLYSDSIIEISHESLMRIWTRLKNWVDEESESAEMYKRISEAAALYQVGRTGLWRPPDLQLALNWQKKQGPTRYWAQRYDETFERALVFLDTSRITYESEQENQELLQKRILRRTRATAAFLGIAAVIAILFGILSLTNRIEATRQFEKAEEQRIAAEEATKRANESLLIAKEAEADARASQAEAMASQQATERANEQLQKALENEQIARNLAIENQIKAESEAERAMQATKEARRQQGRAEEATKLANDRGMLAIAAALAGKSLRERDPELRALMAQQSYKYNASFGGKEFDNMIYDALYYSLATYAGEDYNMFNGHRDAVKSVVFSGNGNQFYSTGSDGKIYQWNMDDTQQPPVLIDGAKSRHSNRSVRISPDKKWLLSTSDSATMKLFDLNNLNTKPIILTGHRGFVRDAEFMPDNSGIVSVGSDGTIFFYDFKRSRLLKQLQYPITTIEIEPDGNYIYGGTTKGQIIRISMQDMSETVVTSSDDISKIVSLDISADGKWLAYGGVSGTAIIYDLLYNKILQSLHGHTARVNAIAFSNKGERLATASWDGTIQVWNMTELDDLPYYLQDNGSSHVWDLSFSPDDKYMVVGTKDGKIKKWAVDNITMADQICQHLSRNMTEEEWKRYVSKELNYETTCENLPDQNNIQ